MSTFIDTNIAVYAFGMDHRADEALAILRRENDISVQVLNEFAAVARRKLAMDWAEVDLAIATIRRLSGEVYRVDLDTHLLGRRLAERYQFRIYDALIVACALLNGGTTLLSEDLHDGLVVDGQLTIRNPFA